MKTIKAVGLLAATALTMSALIASTSYAAARCNLFLRNAAFCEKPITPGVTIESQNRRPVFCTAGPLVIPTRDRSLTYLLTAGHCIADAGRNGRWYSRTRAGGTRVEIGQSGPYILSSAADIGTIRVTNTNWIREGNIPVFAASAEWLRNEGTTVPILGEIAQRVGEVNCLEGQLTGGLCGVIAATGRSLGFPARGVTINGLAYDSNVFSGLGDSGAPVIVTKLVGYEVEGTNVGFNTSTFRMIYEPIGTSLRELNTLRRLSLVLLTTGNEERPVQNREEKEAGERIEAKEREEEVSERVQREEEEAGEKVEKEEQEREEKELKEKPKIIPEATEARPVSFSTKSGASTFEEERGLGAISCRKDTGTGSVNAEKSGTYSITFSECTAPIVGECTSLEAARGTIATTGTFNLRFLTKEAMEKHEKAVVAFFPGRVHITCGIVTITLSAGCVQGALSPVDRELKSTEHYTVRLEGKGGKQNSTKILNEAGTAEETCELKASENGGAERPVDVNGTEELSGTEQGGRAIETEISA